MLIKNRNRYNLKVLVHKLFILSRWATFMSMNIIEMLKSSIISIVFNNTYIESGVNEP